MGYIRVYDGDKLKWQFALTAEPVTIGRTSENGVVLNDPGVSRHHATIIHEDGSYFVVDNQSRNGIFLNKKRVQREKLSYHDEIQIHNFIIKFMATEGIGSVNDDAESDQEVGDEKTMFVSLATEKQLENLRQKSRQAYLVYKNKQGGEDRFLMKSASASIGKSSSADIRLSGFFTPAFAVRIERQGSNFQLIPEKRGKVIFNGQVVKEPIPIKDGQGFLVRNREFKFFNRLIKT